MSQAITVSAVHKHYGTLHALQGVDMAIERGEFFGLLGPNGAGKTTLINLMAGLTLADTGRVTVLGHDVVTNYRQARRRLGVVPQELAFDPFFTVREVLRIQAGYFGMRRRNRAWIDELMEALRLTDKAGVNMRALSGGMKRRVMIAQALVHKPEVVVLDEPTAGVDVELRRTLWDFIRRLHREGSTIVLTTHYLEEAEALCERIAILDQGSVVAMDSTRRLLARGIGRIQYVNITTDAPIAALPEELRDKVRLHEGNHMELQLNKGSDSIVRVMDAVRATGAEITDLHTEQADLEDVFVDLIRKRA